MTSRGEWLFLESVCETQAVFIWSNKSHLDFPAGFTLVLEAKDVSIKGTVSQLAITHTPDRLRVPDLAPGHVYHFSLVLRRPSGASQTLGPVFIVHTKPNRPLNLTVTNVSSNQIEVCWTTPDTTQGALFEGYILNWVDTASGRGRTVRLDRTIPMWVTLLPVEGTSVSLRVRWRSGQGVTDSFILSIRNSTVSLQTNQSASDDRVYRFDNRVPGRVYTVEVCSVHGDRTSSPASVTVKTPSEPPDDLTFIEQELPYSLVGDRPLQRQGYLHESNISVHDLTSGGDFRFEIQFFLESDSENISIRTAGFRSLSISYVNATSAMVSWVPIDGPFDHYRVRVCNTSQSWSSDVSQDSPEFTVSSLRGSTTIILNTGRSESLNVTHVSPHSFSLQWLASPGCDKSYLFQRPPDHSNITIIFTTTDTYAQAQVSSVTPGTSYSVTVNAVASSGFSSPVSRILITTNESLEDVMPNNPGIPAAPSKPEGERVGSTGILLSWRMPIDASIHSFVIKYKEMCPYPEPSFTEITKSLDIPETLLNTLTPGATYNIKVAAVNKAGVGPFSQSLYYKTAEA
ncbi:hypothetical protein DNTS_031765, partial [Danionella cerebrum]